MSKSKKGGLHYKGRKHTKRRINDFHKNPKARKNTDPKTYTLCQASVKRSNPLPTQRRKTLISGTPKMSQKGNFMAEHRILQMFNLKVLFFN